MAEPFAGLFPTDSLRNTRFSINFFISIGLGALTDGMQLHLAEAANAARAHAAAMADEAAAAAGAGGGGGGAP
jgi:pre-mRNA-splicing factor CWC22